jgi:hypothetical protein
LETSIVAQFARRRLADGGSITEEDAGESQAWKGRAFSRLREGVFKEDRKEGFRGKLEG